jgi:epsin
VYTDETGKDVGANVRQKAKDITNLLQDDERLRSERKSRGAMRDRMLGNLATSGLQGDRDYGDRRSPPPQSSRPPKRSGNEDDDLQKAIAESMRMQEEEAKRRSQVTQEEDDLQRALRLSEDEEAKRKRELEQANQTALFDDSLNLYARN